MVLTPALRRKIAGDESFEWIPLKQLDHVTLSGPHKRWIAEILGQQD